MTKRKLLLVALSLCMVAILAMGGTLAYLTDNDTKTNTFTVGNVDIHIDEWQKDEEGNWEPYDEKQKLSPIAYSKTTSNKLVETVNDGTEDAYIRTFVTCPTDMYDYLGLGFNKQDKVLTNDDKKNMYSLTEWTDIGTITIGTEEVSVFMCEYTGKVASGESVLSLTKVWLYDTVTNEAIDSFDLNNGAFEVKVYSEAIQSENLTYEEAMAALNNGKTDLEHAAELFNK